MMPFEAVRILTLVSPLLDPPEKDDVAGRQQGAFWPCVGGQPFRFHVAATDTDGNPVDLAMPLIFVGKDETDADYDDSIVPDASPCNDEKIQAAYESATWPGTGGKRATVPLGGQKVAFAESAEADDTAFAVQSLTFGGEVPAKAKYDALGPKVVRFFPVVRKAVLDVPSLQRIAQTTKAADVVYPHDYLVDGFDAAANPARSSSRPTPAPPTSSASPSAPRAIAPAASSLPTCELSGLSRLSGPMSGDIELAAQGTFDPRAWFGALDGAKLFGVLSLGDILDGVGFDELDKLPQLTGQALNQVEQLISGLERLRSLAEATPAPETAALSSAARPAARRGDRLDPGACSTAARPAVVVSQLAVVDRGAGRPPRRAGGEQRSRRARRAVIVADARPALQQSDRRRGRARRPARPLRRRRRAAAGAQRPLRLAARAHATSARSRRTGTRNLLLSVEAADALGRPTRRSRSPARSTTSSSTSRSLILEFERVQLQAVAGRKMDVDVRFDEFAFAGPLSFVETLRELIPFDGFSDPPDVQVTPEGITAGFTMGLPNLSVGVFSLENLSLGAGFDVPFVGKPMSTWFRFCERENPSRLTVSLFGGGFYLGVTVDADGPPGRSRARSSSERPARSTSGSPREASRRWPGSTSRSRARTSRWPATSGCEARSRRSGSSRSRSSSTSRCVTSRQRQVRRHGHAQHRDRRGAVQRHDRDQLHEEVRRLGHRPDPGRGCFDVQPDATSAPGTRTAGRSHDRSSTSSGRPCRTGSTDDDRLRLSSTSLRVCETTTAATRSASSASSPPSSSGPTHRNALRFEVAFDGGPSGEGIPEGDADPGLWARPLPAEMRVGPHVVPGSREARPPRDAGAPVLQFLERRTVRRPRTGTELPVARRPARAAGALPAARRTSPTGHATRTPSTRSSPALMSGERRARCETGRPGRLRGRRLPAASGRGQRLLPGLPLLPPPGQPASRPARRLRSSRRRSRTTSSSTRSSSGCSPTSRLLLRRLGRRHRPGGRRRRRGSCRRSGSSASVPRRRRLPARAARAPWNAATTSTAVVRRPAAERVPHDPRSPPPAAPRSTTCSRSTSTAPRSRRSTSAPPSRRCRTGAPDRGQGERDRAAGAAIRRAGARAPEPGRPAARGPQGSPRPQPRDRGRHDTVFNAEDLVRGYRVDVFDEDAPSGARWFSLHRRVVEHVFKPSDGGAADPIRSRPRTRAT